MNKRNVYKSYRVIRAKNLKANCAAHTATKAIKILSGPAQHIHPESRWCRSRKLSKCPGEVAGILESGFQTDINDAALGIAEVLFSALDPLEQNKIVGRSACTLFEQFREIVWAHVGNRRKFR
jgi:hypothetical protein